MSNSREVPQRGTRGREHEQSEKGDRYNFEGIEEVSTNSVARIGVREPKGADTAEIRKLSDLLELSRTLSSTLNLKAALARVRSEERRVGKECRSRWSTSHSKKKYNQ